MTKEGGYRPIQRDNHTSRSAKVAKVATLIESRKPLAGASILEIGTCGGIAANFLAEQVGTSGEVHSVDVEDMRVVSDGYHFQVVEGTSLPFDDDSFDVVISNHTIEHVGGPEEQLVHLREMMRTLRPDGVAYLASPSRWALVEPHFKVPLLSWLPPAARSRALQMSRRGRVYDVSPRTRSEMIDLVDEAGFDAEDMTVDAVHVAADLESGVVARLAARVPDGLLRGIRGAVPTMIFLLTPDQLR